MGRKIMFQVILAHFEDVMGHYWLHVSGFMIFLAEVCGNPVIPAEAEKYSTTWTIDDGNIEESVAM